MDPSGKVLREVPFPKESGFFSDLTVDSSGNLFMIDSIGKRVFTASKNSSEITPLGESLQEDLNFPTGIAADDQGNLFIVDQNGGGVVILGRDGTFRGRQLSMGWKEGLLRYPSQICINKKGNVFIAERGNNRFQIFSIVR
jgi:hypothetical protein